MSEPRPQCRNTQWTHLASPLEKHAGYCFECWNVGIPDRDEEIDRLRDELRRLREAAEPLAMEWREYVASNGAGAAITTTGLLVRTGPLRELAVLLPAKEG